MEEASSSIDRAAACRAYVGEATPAAAEYHCNDFDWEDLKQEAEAVLAERHAQLQVTRLVAANYLCPVTVCMSVCRMHTLASVIGMLGVQSRHYAQRWTIHY